MDHRDCRDQLVNLECQVCPDLTAYPGFRVELDLRGKRETSGL